MNASGRLIADIQHVPPAALVGELGAEDVEDAAAQRAIRMRGPAGGSPTKARQRSIRATSREPSIAGAMKSTPIPASRSVKPVEINRDDDANAKIADEEPQDDRAVRVPGRGWIGDSRNARSGRTSDPRSSERRSTGDPAEPAR